MPNRLALESSPYLQQHKNNPVDWYPWSEEALARARSENKPILLSIGYSACHWCHVMEHESFENPEIARLMNENFINIKVDREERPDLDQIYQNVAQAITRSGGWPLTVFLTPDLKPFFGGTYYPPEDRWGRPGFPRVLKALSDAFRNDGASVQENAQKLTEFIRSLSESEATTAGKMPDRSGLESAAQALLEEVDWNAGGIGGAPKFPNSMMLDFLWRMGQASCSEQAMEAAIFTFTQMASGGIHDQLGGGFHRYSVDATWSVPHFEKMLYDNGLLLRSYSQLLLTSPREAAGTPRAGALNDMQRGLFSDVLCHTLEWLEREMISPEGAFYASQDADSEGEEGKFFVWDPADLKEHLSPDEAEVFSLRYGVSQTGNFEHGKTVLYLAMPPDEAASRCGRDLVDVKRLLGSAREKLKAVRSQRIPPATDDKILASWNGLMISGLAWTSQALAREGRNDSAQEFAVKAWSAANRSFDFLRKTLAGPDHRLFSCFKNGQARLNAYLDDYAFLALAAIDLARFEPDESRVNDLLDQAEAWISTVLQHFSGAPGGGYFFTSDDHEALIQRPTTIYDQAIPSGAGVVIHCLLALGEMDRSGKGEHWEEEARRHLSLLYPKIEKRPYGYGELLNASLMSVLGPVVVSGPDSEKSWFHPWVFRKSADVAGQGRTLLCHRKTCESAMADEDEIQKRLTFRE